MAGKKVVDARADERGNITAVRFQGNHSFTPVERAMDMADRGQIANAHTVHLRDGSRYLRSNPDRKVSNNLDELAER